MTELQLDFAGREVPIQASITRWHPSRAQRALLALARRPEGVTALQAGVVLHTRRKSLGTGKCGYGQKGVGRTKRGGCCFYAASDGSAALRRLVERGVIRQRSPRGPYFAVQNV